MCIRDSPYGAPEEVADFLAPYAEAGCRHFNVMPIAANVESALEGVAEIRDRLRQHYA